MDSSAPQSAAPSVRQDARTIGLVGVAHGTSHFFHMLLPPMFPAFMRDFGLSYAELGLLVTLFFVVSGIGQATAGFVVDRIGARPVLFAALGCFVAASLAAATAQGYGGLLLAAGLAGLGNSPFHPVDFTILNKRVAPARLGHAFSVHGISGNLGWAVAPAFLLGLQTLGGHWRWAYVGTGAWALAVLLAMWIHRDAVDDRQGRWAHERDGGPAGSAEHPLAFLKLPSVWLCFSFFFWSTAALAAVQGFASPALERLYGLPLTVTTMVVTGFMLCAAIGMVFGGFLVPRADRLEGVIGAALLLAASLLLLGASGWLPAAASALCVSLAGFGTGLAGPSRDMLIKRATPPGATGRVYGTVYSGLDVGFAVASPIFGSLMDRGQPGGVLAGAALALLCGVASAGLVGMATRARRPLAA